MSHMDRRDFISTLFKFSDSSASRVQSGAGRKASPTATGLDPYVPSTAQPWDEIRAGHLLRRTTFGPRWTDVSHLLSMTPSDAVDAVVNGTSALPAAPTCANDGTESLDGLDITSQAAIRAQWIADDAVLRKWYAAVFCVDDAATTEK